MERASQLRDGKAPWTTATGLVVRGYVSKIDGSVQPYGLVVPAIVPAERLRTSTGSTSGFTAAARTSAS